ncbi:MAG: hypothetical protein HXY47_00990 [Nitrospirae bacterium]|nr:hypothetical protein [Nitrospirota bacterium]
MFPISSEEDLHLSENLYYRTLDSIKEIFDSDHIKLQKIKILAQRIKEGIENISPFIQHSTEIICPRCTNICCINKHGYYSYEDLIYVNALGLEPPGYDFTRDDSAPCQFLSGKGCIMDRSMRPSGCNWYFCEDLLDYMERRPEYGSFDNELKDIAELWLEMMSEFERVTSIYLHQRSPKH